MRVKLAEPDSTGETASVSCCSALDLPCSVTLGPNGKLPMKLQAEDCGREALQLRRVLVGSHSRSILREKGELRGMSQTLGERLSRERTTISPCSRTFLNNRGAVSIGQLGGGGVVVSAK